MGEPFRYASERDVFCGWWDVLSSPVVGGVTILLQEVIFKELSNF